MKATYKNVCAYKNVGATRRSNGDANDGRRPKATEIPNVTGTAMLVGAADQGALSRKLIASLF